VDERTARRDGMKTTARVIDIKTGTDRRQDHATAETFTNTEFDRRHSEADCKADPMGKCCATCGRPMTEMETLIYRAL
jgi:hypothetical protein